MDAPLTAADLRSPSRHPREKLESIRGQSPPEVPSFETLMHEREVMKRLIDTLRHDLSHSQMENERLKAELNALQLQMPLRQQESPQTCSDAFYETRSSISSLGPSSRPSSAIGREAVTLQLQALMRQREAKASVSKKKEQEQY